MRRRGSARCEARQSHCEYHIVWITKYRFPVLGGEIGAINRDHVHMLIGILPHMPAVQYLKGKSSRKFLS